MGVTLHLTNVFCRGWRLLGWVKSCFLNYTFKVLEKVFFSPPRTIYSVNFKVTKNISTRLQEALIHGCQYIFFCFIIYIYIFFIFCLTLHLMSHLLLFKPGGKKEGERDRLGQEERAGWGLIQMRLPVRKKEIGEEREVKVVGVREMKRWRWG